MASRKIAKASEATIRANSGIATNSELVRKRRMNSPPDAACWLGAEGVAVSFDVAAPSDMVSASRVVMRRALARKLSRKGLWCLARLAAGDAGEEDLDIAAAEDRPPPGGVALAA